MGNNIGKLMDAILTAWTKCLPPPYGSGDYSAAVDDVTDCNRFVFDVMAQFGYKKLWDSKNNWPMRANQMQAELEINGDWLDVPGSTAQNHANSGALVVAAWKNPVPNKSGHVCIVMPGQCVGSGKWQVPVDKPTVPKVANVGRPSLCRLDRGANYAFGMDQPKYYALKSMI